MIVGKGDLLARELPKWLRHIALDLTRHVQYVFIYNVELLISSSAMVKHRATALINESLLSIPWMSNTNLLKLQWLSSPLPIIINIVDVSAAWNDCLQTTHEHSAFQIFVSISGLNDFAIHIQT